MISWTTVALLPLMYAVLSVVTLGVSVSLFMQSDLGDMLGGGVMTGLAALFGYLTAVEARQGDARRAFEEQRLRDELSATFGKRNLRRRSS